MVKPTSKPATKSTSSGSGNFKLVVDVLGYLDDDGARQELEGRGKVFKGSDLHPNAIANGKRTGALVKVKDKATDTPEPADAVPTLADLNDDELARLAAEHAVEDFPADGSHDEKVASLAEAGVSPPPPGA